MTSKSPGSQQSTLDDELLGLELCRKLAVELEQEATLRREHYDKQIQRVRRLIHERKCNLPLATKPGDWTESK